VDVLANGSWKSLLGKAVQELSPRARNIISAALVGAISEATGVPRRLLQALAEALRQRDRAQAAALLQAEGRHWAETDHAIETLSEHAIAAARLLGNHLRLAGEDDEIETVRLAFLSEISTGYLQAREEISAQHRSSELSARMNELAALHKVISAANSSLDLDSTLHLVVQTVASVMQVEVCELYLFEPERGTLVLGASVGLNPEAEGLVRLRLGTGVTGWVAQQGRPVAVPDVHQEPRFLYEPSLHEDPYWSLLSVPIILYTVEKLVGVINVRTREVRVYTPEEINFLEMVAGEMAMSLENARLYQETDQRLRQKVDELTTLQRVSAMVVGTLDLDETLGLITEQAAKLARADWAVIVEWDALLREPILVASWGLDEGTQERMQQWLQHDQVYAQMAGSVGGVVVRANQETILGQWTREAGFNSLLCIALRGKEELLGAICLHVERPEGFGHEQVDLLTIFADQAALAIENAGLYSELRRSLEMKSTLLQEMHHRVRNNLQAVASLLNIQMRRVRDRHVVHLLEESASRIQSIAAVHDLLCEGTLGVTTVQEVALKVLEVACAYLVRPGLDLKYQVIEEPPLPIASKEATLLALLFNELFANAVSHGFAEREEGLVIVDAYLSDGQAVLQVKDNGHGPEHEGEEESEGLGLQIVSALVTRDLRGSFSLQRDGNWTVAIISFPHYPPQDLDAPELTSLTLTMPSES
jgi:two-component sensor histidine kinase